MQKLYVATTEPRYAVRADRIAKSIDEMIRLVFHNHIEFIVTPVAGAIKLMHKSEAHATGICSTEKFKECVEVRGGTLCEEYLLHVKSNIIENEDDVFVLLTGANLNVAGAKMYGNVIVVKIGINPVHTLLILAHEIGHLYIPENCHNPRCIMSGKDSNIFSYYYRHEAYPTLCEECKEVFMEKLMEEEK